MAGTTQHWDPDRYLKHAGFVPQLGRPVIELAAPKAGERVLDLGCGDGTLTADLVQLGCDVVGVDASREQILAARGRGINARVVDGESLDFEAEFDLVVSNAAMHWMKNQPAVIAGVWRALKAGGRFVSEMGGGANVATIVAAIESAMVARGIDPRPANPWFFPTAEEERGLLEQAGFDVLTIDLFERPTPLPGDIEGWLWTFAESFLNRVPEPDRAPFIDEVRRALDPKLRNADGVWIADYVRLRFSARKPD